MGWRSSTVSFVAVVGMLSAACSDSVASTAPVGEGPTQEAAAANETRDATVDPPGSSASGPGTVCPEAATVASTLDLVVDNPLGEAVKGNDIYRCRYPTEAATGVWVSASAHGDDVDWAFDRELEIHSSADELLRPDDDSLIDVHTADYSHVVGNDGPDYHISPTSIVRQGQYLCQVGVTQVGTNDFEYRTLLAERTLALARLVCAAGGDGSAPQTSDGAAAMFLEQLGWCDPAAVTVEQVEGAIGLGRFESTDDMPEMGLGSGCTFLLNTDDDDFANVSLRTFPDFQGVRTAMELCGTGYYDCSEVSNTSVVGVSTERLSRHRTWFVSWCWDDPAATIDGHSIAVGVTSPDAVRSHESCQRALEFFTERTAELR